MLAMQLAHSDEVVRVLRQTYVLRSDGKVDRFKSATSKNAGIECPDDGVRFESGTCANSNSYMLGSNGAIYRFRSATDISKMEAPGDGVTYVSVSGGVNTSYFVRSDGKIDGSRGSGKIDFTVDTIEGSPLVLHGLQVLR